MLTKFLALLAFAAGFVLIGLSLIETSARFADHFATYAVAAWVFAAACGIWHISHLIETIMRYVDKKDAENTK